MQHLSSLVSALPEISQSRMVSTGYTVWMVWDGKLNSAIPHTMRDYGCILMTEENSQALWFSPGTEVFRALARLQTWARVNSISVFCQIFSAAFLVGYDLSTSLSVPQELTAQQVGPPSDFEVWVHPKLEAEVNNVAGLGLKASGKPEGISSLEWKLLQADQGLDYESTLRWYFIIKPLGKGGDKESIVGWRDFSHEIQELMKRLGLKYIADVNEGFLFFPLDNVRLLRTFCTDMLNLISEAKADESKKYWPVVMAAVPQGDLPFTQELPKKVGLDWNRLTPDFPHMRFVDGFILSPWFILSDSRYGKSQTTLESWCNLRLRKEGGEADYGTIEVSIAVPLTQGEGLECFYCGQKNHLPADCPTKSFGMQPTHAWNRLAGLNLDAINEGVTEINSRIDIDNFPATAMELLGDKKSDGSIVLQAIFEVNSPTQFRTLRKVWRSKAKEWAEGFDQLGPEEGDHFWAGLDALVNEDVALAETEAKKGVAKYTRSYQPQSLLGFVNLEQNDYVQALFHWQEAERLAFTPLQQGYLVFLQARLQEVQDHFKEANALYKRVNALCPGWIEPLYRQGVCMVKLGFTGQAMDLFFDLINMDPNVFNRILVDPELERGRVQLLSFLWDKWNEAEKDAEELRKKLDEYIDELDKRFDRKHPFHDAAEEELQRLKKTAEVNNYVAYRMLSRGMDRFSERLEKQVQLELKRINSNVDFLSERIKEIQKEAAWFPFPKLLVEFNRDFNYCVEKINWIKTQYLKQADNFRLATQYVEEIEKRVETLSGRLVTLRIVRDSTLFVLMLGKSFIWFELVGLGLAFIGVPGFIWFTQDVQGNWLVTTLRENQWEVTKGFVIILSALALAFAAIKSAAGFEKRKQQLFDQLDTELKGTAPRRY
ncbi:tetratricopeptide repeat protein [Salidesulfovibrio brasiliensis]